MLSNCSKVNATPIESSLSSGWSWLKMEELKGIFYIQWFHSFWQTFGFLWKITNQEISKKEWNLFLLSEERITKRNIRHKGWDFYEPSVQLSLQEIETVSYQLKLYKYHCFPLAGWIWFQVTQKEKMRGFLVKMRTLLNKHLRLHQNFQITPFCFWVREASLFSKQKNYI